MLVHASEKEIYELHYDRGLASKDFDLLTIVGVPGDFQALQKSASKKHVARSGVIIRAIAGADDVLFRRNLFQISPLPWNARVVSAQILCPSESWTLGRVSQLGPPRAPNPELRSLLGKIDRQLRSVFDDN